MTSGPSHAPLLVDDLRRACAGRFGHSIHYFDVIDSTSTRAQRLAMDGMVEGTVVIAEAQTKGRGRLGRTWASPPYRNLYLSLILRPPIAVADAPQLTLVAGVAVVEAVRAWVPGALIKWPNDVLVGGRKLAGILTEMEAEDGRVRFVILGIGVNLNAGANEFPPELRDKAVSVCALAGAPVDRVAFAARLLSQLQERYDLFLRAGFAAIRPLWEGSSCLTGRNVHIEGGDGSQNGIVIGLAADGALRLRDATGREVRVVAGDVTVVDGYE